MEFYDATQRKELSDRTEAPDYKHSSSEVTRESLRRDLASLDHSRELDRQDARDVTYFSLASTLAAGAFETIHLAENAPLFHVAYCAALLFSLLCVYRSIEAIRESNFLYKKREELIKKNPEIL
ncbi:MAG: hypothetical protein KAT43_05035 [Nanoarchaeota archaeon]|nr:hypothetical protein [Nanoarchaeota archaeon]